MNRWGESVILSPLLLDPCHLPGWTRRMHPSVLFGPCCLWGLDLFDLSQLNISLHRNHSLARVSRPTLGAAPVCSHGSIDILKSPTLSARATAGKSSTESAAISAWTGPADTRAVAAAAAGGGHGTKSPSEVRIQPHSLITSQSL